MKKKGYLIWMILFCGWSVFAQRGASLTKKNSVSFFYTPMYAKTNFTNLDQVIISNTIQRLLDTESPNIGIYGYSYGIRYYRKINAKWHLGLGVQYTLLGQRSSKFYSINGVSDAVLDNLPDYGGTLYKISYNSYEIPLAITYQFKQRNKVSYFLNVEGLLNIYNKVHANRYIISRSNGQRMPSLYESYFKATGNLFNVLKRHLDLGLWRVGVAVGAGITYEPWPFLSLSASPEFRYYSNLKDTSEASTIVEGDIYSIGMALSTHLKF